MKKLYNHMLDVAFTVRHSEHANWEQVPMRDILNGLQARLDYLRSHPEECADAFGFSDTYEEDQAPQYKVELIVGQPGERRVVVFECAAVNFADAEAQARRAHKDGMIVSIKYGTEAAPLHLDFSTQDMA